MLRQGVIAQEGNQDSCKKLSFWLRIKTQTGNQDSGKELRLRLGIRTHTDREIKRRQEIRFRQGINQDSRWESELLQLIRAQAGN